MENASNIMKEIIWENTKKCQQQQEFAQELYAHQNVFMSLGDPFTLLLDCWMIIHLSEMHIASSLSLLIFSLRLCK